MVLRLESIQLASSAPIQATQNPPGRARFLAGWCSIVCWHLGLGGGRSLEQYSPFATTSLPVASLWSACLPAYRITLVSAADDWALIIGLVLAARALRIWIWKTGKEYILRSKRPQVALHCDAVGGMVFVRDCLIVYCDLTRPSMKHVGSICLS